MLHPYCQMLSNNTLTLLYLYVVENPLVIALTSFAIVAKLVFCQICLLIHFPAFKKYLCLLINIISFTSYSS